MGNKRMGRNSSRFREKIIGNNPAAGLKAIPQPQPFCIVRKWIIACMTCLYTSVLSAQEVQDTTQTLLLDEVKVSAFPLPPSFKAGSPVQIWRSEDLAKINALQVSDAIKFFAGAQVKDYGGVGGLKTVSIRSLGANYTNVAYDGIAVADYPTGQIDLGRFSLENVEMITFHSGESNVIFQPARLQALGGSINIITQTFRATAIKKNEIKVAVKAGSFGTINPSLQFNQALNQTFTLGLSGEYLQTDGNYPFSLTYGNSDSSAVKKRLNSDVTNLKLETNVSGQFETGGKLLVKSYYYDSERGIPGPAIYYNDYKDERLHDQNFFSQAAYTQSLSHQVDFQVNAKFNYAHTDYVNRLYNQQNLYDQREYYLNVTGLYKVSDALSFSWANDGIYGNFSNNFNNFVFPSRMIWMSAVSGKYEKQNYTLTGSLLNIYVDESVKKGQANPNSNHLSPSVSLSVKPLDKFPARLRFFYKNTYRLPTFADMYYSTVPNTKLKAENAHQYNLGFTFFSSVGNSIPYFSFSADVYYNQVENKIVALPLSSMVIWSVLNYGKADVRGIDLNLKIQWSISAGFSTEINGNYTYQNVQDKTAGSEYYGKHLPYTPYHIANGFASFKTPWFDFNYNFIYSGDRYANQSKQVNARLKRYVEQGIACTKNVHWKNYHLNFSAECLNFLNEQYEVVKEYPMPGRNYRLRFKFIY
jgi:outer membrane cobalamin receptor